MNKKLLLVLLTILVVALRGPSTTFAGPAVANMVQTAYRWRNDNGSETTATWKADENITITDVSLTEIIRIRFEVEENGGANFALDPQIEFSSDATSCTTGAWTPLDTSSTAWRVTASANITDTEVTTNQLTTSALTFQVGQMYDTSNPGPLQPNLKNKQSEYEWSIRGDGAAGDTTYRFRVTDAGTPLNIYTNCAQLTTATLATTFTQSNYRWYVDNDTIDPTDPWGNPNIVQNTSITITPTSNDPPNSTQELRLRINFTVNTVNLSATSQQFKLQFRTGTDTDCSTGSWTDVAAVAASAWQFATSSVGDGTTLTTNKLTSDAIEVYAISNPTATNPNGANTGQTIEYDFHIIGSGSDFASATQYLFRAVESDDTVFDGYTNCAVLQTEPGTGDLLRHGNVFSGGLEQGFFWTD